MKKLFVLAAICLVFFACSDKKAQEEKLLDSVGSVHEKLMGLDDQLDKNKSSLDALIKQLPAGAQIDSAKAYRDKVMIADSVMMTWMHGFQPDSTFKSEEEKMNYLHTQKTLIMHIDSQMNEAFKTSSDYLAKNKKK